MSVVLLSVIAPMTTRLRQRRVICPSIRVSARGSVCVCVCACACAHVRVEWCVCAGHTSVCVLCVCGCVCTSRSRLMVCVCGVLARGCDFECVCVDEWVGCFYV